ncbi:aspartyl-phosphate phosphatase Spo0E family protein [Halalkalibacter urbisdiaboli]|uniref:aspartyl-phosphate phosphatase Spo0E family protein n=1 Tax=Halalkalibacter urbisdiaboli TaxID=1960589 RepID=UPI000B440540|nr:aspartyl-phosphate phosphatase Spo0E family protein [Halalkalibacter urbisdiaboli]
MSEMILREAIEQKRDHLIKIGLSKGLSSKSVLELSQELDRLLNQYEKEKDHTLNRS